ncbi:uncharacterized protein LOC121787298 isoform X2 [Salvia splendens]|uniref:uncharacterized protein LOC121787298 isoform X2 n=1 Tax=Salvia splendens TaxID=180675 RepID=UPI001C276DA2|nr:uncharacterized protein LOC121787298 isoform X2 [Salvia splendens]
MWHCHYPNPTKLPFRWLRFVSLRGNQRLEMAAYASVASLINTTEQIMDHPQLATSFDPKQMESLREIVDFLLDFMESCTSHGSSEAARDLESQIASAAHAAEDVIESHVVDQIHVGSNQTSSDSLLNLHKVIDEMDYVKLKVQKE